MEKFNGIKASKLTQSLQNHSSNLCAKPLNVLGEKIFTRYVQQNKNKHK